MGLRVGAVKELEAVLHRVWDLSLYITSDQKTKKTLSYEPIIPPCQGSGGI